MGPFHRSIPGEVPSGPNVAYGRLPR